MIGGAFASTEESPGEKIIFQPELQILPRHGICGAGRKTGKQGSLLSGG
ncbi:MAG: hypothetical protein R2860_11970 [Desulfobacterales bacterium]